MKKLFLLAALCFLSEVQAQTFEWVKSPAINFNANPDMIGYVTATDHDNDVYLCGFVDNNYIYTDIFGDLFLKKYDSAGNLLWDKSFSGKGQVYKMVTDSQKNILVCAAFIGNLNLGNQQLNTTEQGVQAIVLKFSPDGSLVWNQQIEINEFADVYFKSLVVDAQDNIYIGYDDFGNSYIEKLSPEGNSLMTITQNNVSLISSVSVDNQGNIYAAGSCARFDANFNGTTAPASFQYNSYISKYNSLGGFQWVKYVEDITCPTPQVVANAPDEVYFCSELNGNFAFDNLAVEGPGLNFMSDFFLTKLNAEGQFQWMREIIGNGRAYLGHRNFLNLDTQGNIYFVGSFSENISWNSQFQSQSNGFRDALLLKYNPQGDVVLTKSVGGSGYDRFDSVSVDANGNIYLSGMGSGSFQFDSIPFAGTSLYSPFLAKLNPTLLSVSEQNSSAVSIYPNPVNNQFYLNSNQIKTLTLYNLLGQKIKELSNRDSGIDISDVANGTYLLKTDSGITLKLCKN
ncbi:MAG: T9SS type A sorting domain-containing protein [Flavobacteriaceae bacterium]